MLLYTPVYRMCLFRLAERKGVDAMAGRPRTFPYLTYCSTTVNVCTIHMVLDIHAQMAGWLGTTIIPQHYGNEHHRRRENPVDACREDHSVIAAPPLFFSALDSTGPHFALTHARKDMV